MGSPRVSIITPTLNQGRFIEQMLRSVESQTYRHFEHLVVDGGSSDGTDEIVSHFRARYPLVWVSEPDEGMYDAINKGLRRVTGDIICYLNSDDLYFPWTLETVVAEFERDPQVDLVVGDALTIDALGREDILFQARIDYAQLRTGSYIQPTVFWRRRVYEAIGEFDTRYKLAGDLDYWIRIGPNRRVSRVDEIIAVDRGQPNSKRSTQWEDLMRESRAARRPINSSSRMHRGLAGLRSQWTTWMLRRICWLQFLLETRRRNGRHDRWPQFLNTYTVKLVPFRFLLGQAPWLGRRVSSGIIRTALRPDL